MNIRDREVQKSRGQVTLPRRRVRLVTESGENKLFDALDYDSHKSSSIASSSFRVHMKIRGKEHEGQAEERISTLKVSASNESGKQEESRRNTISVLQDRTSSFNRDSSVREQSKVIEERPSDYS